MRPTMSGSLFLHEARDAIEHLATGAQVARAREWQVKGRAYARGVANVVDKEAQAELMLALRRTNVE